VSALRRDTDTAHDLPGRTPRRSRRAVAATTAHAPKTIRAASAQRSAIPQAGLICSDDFGAASYISPPP
jgi:hypothetical protein